MIEASRRDDALQILQVGASLEPVVRTNIDLWELPAAPAAQVYSGCCTTPLIWPRSTPRPKSRNTVAARHLGAVGCSPDHRPDPRLPGVDGQRTPRHRSARDVLEAAPEGRPGPAGTPGVVVDCRSAAYQKAWCRRCPSGPFMSVTDAATGATVSHMAKHTRGLVARHLLTRSGKHPPPQRVAEAVAERFDVTLAEPRRASTPWTLTVLH